MFYRLRKKPTDHFTVEDLRLMIGQNVGTQYLMPRALGLLEQSPFVWGWHFPGELLSQVLRLPESYWETQPDHLKRTIFLSEVAEPRIKERIEKQSAKQKRHRTKKPSIDTDIEINVGLTQPPKMWLSVRR